MAEAEEMQSRRRAARQGSAVSCPPASAALCSSCWFGEDVLRTATHLKQLAARRPRASFGQVGTSIWRISCRTIERVRVILPGG